jgi:predicted Zn-dependent protease
MAGFFYQLGKMIGQPLRKADWVWRSLTGSETEAIDAEYAVGRELARESLREMDIDREPTVEHFLEAIKFRLTSRLTNRRRQFTFRSVLAAEINAFALPGGFIFVSRPLLQLCAWDTDEIAFILSHEMAHVIQRHAIDRLMAHSVFRAAVSRLSLAGGLMRPSLLGLTTQLLNQGYAREQELEADRTGVQIARASGFDARAAVRVLGRLRPLAAEPAGLSGYLSSHPPLDERIQQIRKMCNEVEKR